MNTEVVKILRAKMPSASEIPDAELLEALDGTLILELAVLQAAWCNLVSTIYKELTTENRT